MAEEWLSHGDAVQFIRANTKPPYSVGAAQAALSEAVASKVVRSRRTSGVMFQWNRLPGRGLIKDGDRWVDTAGSDADISRWEVSKGDLEFLCSHKLAHFAQKTTRAFPSKVAGMPTSALSVDELDSSEIVPSSNKAKADCERWLVDEMRKNPRRDDQPKPKEEFLTEASEKFPGLSDRSFIKAWENAVAKAPSEWCEPGRRPKNPRT